MPRRIDVIGRPARASPRTRLAQRARAAAGREPLDVAAPVFSVSSNAPARPHARAPRPMTSVSTPPIAIAVGTPNADAAAPNASPPIGTDAENTVVYTLITRPRR